MQASGVLRVTDEQGHRLCNIVVMPEEHTCDLPNGHQGQYLSLNLDLVRLTGQPKASSCLCFPSAELTSVHPTKHFCVGAGAQTQTLMFAQQARDQLDRLHFSLVSPCDPPASPQLPNHEAIYGNVVTREKPCVGT